MYHTTLLALLLCFLLPQCNDQKKDSATTTNNNSSNKTATTTEETPVANNTPASTGISGDLIGTWQLQLDAFDYNNNELLDPEERAKATPNRTSYQFRKDGTCKIQGIFNGRYEVKKENGKDNLVVYRERIVGEEDEDPKPDHFRILSVSADELVLLMQESHNENTIWIFKRV